MQRDLRYGEAPAHCLDLHLPAGPANGGLIALVHGGGWRLGDKADGRLLGHKTAHWAGRSWTVASIKDKRLPEAGPLKRQTTSPARWPGCIVGAASGASSLIAPC